jgi:hypothetical protein
MAYTIQLNGNTSNAKTLAALYTKRDKVLAYLFQRMAKEGIFRATLTPVSDTKGRPSIRVKPVRLVKAKPYCGNHPGPCQINPFLGPRKKPNSTFLEWEDWIKFHSLVNRVLNRFHADADVWSTPADISGKMWIRKGTKPRLRYSWEETMNNYGRVVQVWNPGTPDQFEAQ